MLIDFSNVQDLIFSDLELQKRLPEFKDLFQQWKLGQIVPSLRPMAQKALLDLLNQLKDDDHINILKEYFKTTIIEIRKLDYNIIKDHSIPICEIDYKIESLNIEGEMFLYRNADRIYIGEWR